MEPKIVKKPAFKVVGFERVLSWTCLARIVAPGQPAKV